MNASVTELSVSCVQSIIQEARDKRSITYSKISISHGCPSNITKGLSFYSFISSKDIEKQKQQQQQQTKAQYIYNYIYSSVIKRKEQKKWVSPMSEAEMILSVSTPHPPFPWTHPVLPCPKNFDPPLAVIQSSSSAFCTDSRQIPHSLAARSSHSIQAQETMFANVIPFQKWVSGTLRD